VSKPLNPSLAQHRKLAAQLGLEASGRTAPDPYFDATGQPQLLNAAVLFLDLLGTRGDRTPEQANAHLRLTHQAVRQARQWSSAGPDKHQEGALYSFSDNISLGYPVHGAWDDDMALWYLVLDSAHLQLAFLVNDLFSRGGIALDLFFADPALDFLHGPALNRAVALEHGCATYPRIVLDQPAVDQIRQYMTAEGQDESSGWREALLIDEEGVVFINYLYTLLEEVLPDVPAAETFLPRHRDLIETNLQQFAGVEGVEAKYRWVAAYHNFFVAEFAEELPEGVASSCQVTCSRPLGQFQPFTSHT
jgi:hypothetical protein